MIASLVGRYISMDVFSSSMAAHSFTISSFDNTLVFGVSFGRFIPTIGEKSMIPRSAAKFHIRTMTDCRRLAPTGARFLTLSIKRTASRLVISPTFRFPQTGMTSFSIRRLRSLPDGVFESSISKNSSSKSATAGAFFRFCFFSIASCPGSTPFCRSCNAKACISRALASPIPGH